MTILPPTDHAQSGVDLISSSKRLLQSLSEGVRNLLVLDEKLGGLTKEGDRSRSEIRLLQDTVSKLLGKIEEMDRRIEQRFSDLDKRYTEIDKRVALQIELAVRKEIDDRLGQK